MEGNKEKAKELLKEADTKNGQGIPTIELMYNSEGPHKDTPVKLSNKIGKKLVLMLN